MPNPQEAVLAAPSEAWHTMDPDAVLAALETSRDGLDDAEAARRRERYGPNVL